MPLQQTGEDDWRPGKGVAGWFIRLWYDLMTLTSLTMLLRHPRWRFGKKKKGCSNDRRPCQLGQDVGKVGKKRRRLTRNTCLRRPTQQ